MALKNNTADGIEFYDGSMQHPNRFETFHMFGFLWEQMCPENRKSHN